METLLGLNKKKDTYESEFPQENEAYRMSLYDLINRALDNVIKFSCKMEVWEGIPACEIICVEEMPLSMEQLGFLF